MPSETSDSTSPTGPHDDAITHSPNIIRRASADDPDLGKLSDQAAIGARNEQDQSILEAFKQYPKAVGWSLLLSTAVIMEGMPMPKDTRNRRIVNAHTVRIGYDTVLITSFFVVEPFLQRYGTIQADGTYNISAAWEQGLGERGS